MMLAALALATLRVSALLAAGLLIASALRYRSAALRHSVVTTTVCGALLVPVLGLMLPSWHVQWPAAGAVPTTMAVGGDNSSGVGITERVVLPSLPSAAASAPASGATSQARMLSIAVPGATATWSAIAIWLLGVLLCALALATRLLRLARIARSATPVSEGVWTACLRDEARAGDTSRIVLLQSDDPSLLATWGTRRPQILLPRGAAAWSADRVRVVLRHEAAHIRRADWIWQLAAEALRALFWFDPLTWIAVNRLRLEAERACDDAVLNDGGAAADYAAHLVAIARALARRAEWTVVPAMARASSLERRVTAMLDPHVTRAPLGRLGRFAIMVGGFALTASVASFAAQSSFATVSGTVHDQLGGTLPRITLTLTDVASGAKHEITSSNTGGFEFVGVPAGNYTLAVWGVGFKPLEFPMQVAAGQVARRDVTLDVGTLQETITVVDVSSANGASTPRRDSAWRMPADNPACTAQPNSGGIKPPTKIKDVRPIYPGSMKGTSTAGLVNLKAVIGADGAVKTIQTIDATNVDFELAAQDAVRQWRFTPTLLTCVPIDVEMNVAISFQPTPPAPPLPPPPPPAPQR
jgi:beta-lactamase regulating signal transducer with metallopeptidase domain